MNTTTMGFNASTIATPTSAKANLASTGLTKSRGAVARFFAAFIDRAIAAREAEARLKVSKYLHYVSDGRLAELGMSASDIQLMRDTGRVPPTFWS